jgi:hypothetical protein
MLELQIDSLLELGFTREEALLELSSSLTELVD